MVNESYDVPVIPVTLRVVGVARVQLPVKPTNELQVKVFTVKLGARATKM